MLGSPILWPKPRVMLRDLKGTCASKYERNVVIVDPNPRFTTWDVTEPMTHKLGISPAEACFMVLYQIEYNRITGKWPYQEDCRWYANIQEEWRNLSPEEQAHIESLVSH